MDFYAFLPSNASPDVYPDNKTSHFKTELSKRMELHGHWQAALIELHYPNTISNAILEVKEGENVITLFSDHEISLLHIPPGNYASKREFVQAVRNTIESYQTSTQNLSTAFEETPEGHVVFPPFTADGKFKVYFAPVLAHQLGLRGPGSYPANKPVFGTRPLDVAFGKPPQMFIYLDILSDQIVGHTRAPLLRTVPVDMTATYGGMSVFRCEHPIYFSLNTKSFDTVEIDIRDHAGEYMPFDFGTSTLLVHFRQLNNGSA